MNSPDTTSVMEDRLRAALAARAELVQPEDLAPLAPVAEPRPRWQSPWVLLSTAAVVLLVLGVVLQGVGRDQRSDDVAPKPDAPQVTLPPDVGRDWSAAEASTPARLDLDGDGTREKVTYRAEPSKEFEGRVRLEATLSSTRQEVHGVADLGTTLGISPLDPIDADGDGDQELVLLHEVDPGLVGGHDAPVVFDLRDGLLVEAAPEEPDLLQRGVLPVPDSQTEFYERAVIHNFWFEDGRLYSGRSSNSYASGNMSLLRPERVALESWVWRLDEAGALRAEAAGCRLDELGEMRPCDGQTEDDPVEVDGPATEQWSVGEGGRIAQGYRFDVRVQPGDPAYVVVDAGGRTLRHDLDVVDPQVAPAQPFGASYDGVSLAVTSGTDPDAITLLGQDGDDLVELRAVGDVPFGNGTTDDGRTHRSWVTADGGVVTAVSTGEDDVWEIWSWQVLRGHRMAGMPRGEACIADIDDPAAGC